MTVVQQAGNQGGNVPNLGRGPSPFIWYDCPVDGLLNGTVDGIHHFDDFDRGAVITAPTTEAALVGQNWSGFSSTASQITYDQIAGGAIKLAETTVDESTAIRVAPACYTMSNVSGSFWMEARFKTLLTATTENSFAIGFMDTTAIAVAVPMLTTGEIADINFFGFHKPDANTTTFNTTYRSNGNAAVVVGTGEGTIAADTFLKVGMKFNPKDRVLRFYVNGVQLATTKTIIDALGTTFPSDIVLGPVVALMVGAAASDNTLTLDWWRSAQIL